MDDDRARRYAAWQEGFARASVHDLIAALNRSSATPDGAPARADHLHALQRAFEACGYDCLSFVSAEDGTMSFKSPLALAEGRIVQCP